nr:RecName: Full=30 kDa cell wall protein [Phaseolus vulgaris]
MGQGAVEGQLFYNVQ